MVSPLPWRTRILNWAEAEGQEDDDWADDIVVVHVEWKQNPSAIFEVAAASRRTVAARIGRGRQPMNFRELLWRSGVPKNDF